MQKKRIRDRVRKTFAFWNLTNRNPLLSFDFLISVLVIIGLVLVILKSIYIIFPSSLAQLCGFLHINRSTFFWGTLIDLIKPLKDTEQSTGILQILTFLFTAYMSKQILVQKKVSYMDVSNDIYEENRDKRSNKDIMDAAKFINELMTSCRTCDDFNNIINDYSQSAKYDSLKELVYHYEYLGFLVYYQKIDFHLLFDTISFPNEIMYAALQNHFGYSFINQIRKSRIDNWMGFEYLYYCYCLMRAKDNLWRNLPNSKHIYEEAKKNWEDCWYKIPK